MTKKNSELLIQKLEADWVVRPATLEVARKPKTGFKRIIDIFWWRK